MYVNPNDRRALRRYINAGFTSVEGGADAPVPQGGLTVEGAAEVTFDDQVLMACTLERWHEIERKGMNGKRGYDRAEAIEAKLLKPKGRYEVDASRGRHGRSGMHVEERMEAHQEGEA